MHPKHTQKVRSFQCPPHMIRNDGLHPVISSDSKKNSMLAMTWHFSCILKIHTLKKKKGVFLWWPQNKTARVLGAPHTYGSKVTHSMYKIMAHLHYPIRRVYCTSVSHLQGIFRRKCNFNLATVLHIGVTLLWSAHRVFNEWGSCWQAWDSINC